MKKFTLIAYSIKAVTGIAGASLILEQHHPYWALIILGLGAIANEAIDIYKLKK